MWDSLDPRSVDSRDREPDDPRDADSVDPRDVFTRDLDLPRGLERERVHVHGHDYDLRGSAEYKRHVVDVFVRRGLLTF